MSDSRYEFYRFRDLLAANIVTSRPDLSAKIRDRAFPKPLKTGSALQATAYWRKADVHRWLDETFPQKPPVRSGTPSRSGEP